MRGLSRIALLLFGLSCLPALAGSGVSKPGCAKCHVAEGLSQPETPMARSLLLPGSNSILEEHPNLSLPIGEYLYSIETKGQESSYSVSDGKNTLSVPILWSFGVKAQSWVVQRDGKLYEGMVSYYPSLRGLAVTLGDERMTPHSLVEALGREMLPEEATSCFGCHTTGAVVNDELHLAAIKPGVTCEHCHVQANEHMSAALRGDFHLAPPDLSKLSAEDMSEFCGKCHRTWATVVRNRMMSEVNVRFQPYRLANSRCFNGTDARIRCIACHNPHVDVVTDGAYYDPKCLACHAQAAGKTLAAVNPEARVCPVAKSNCTSCHMPKVPLPGGHQTFTDHHIRIVRAGEPYPD